MASKWYLILFTNSAASLSWASKVISRQRCISAEINCEGTEEQASLVGTLCYPCELQGCVSQGGRALGTVWLCLAGWCLSLCLACYQAARRLLDRGDMGAENWRMEESGERNFTWSSPWWLRTKGSHSDFSVVMGFLISSGLPLCEASSSLFGKHKMFFDWFALKCSHWKHFQSYTV